MIALTNPGLTQRKKWYPENMGILLKNVHINAIAFPATLAFVHQDFFRKFLAPASVNNHIGVVLVVFCQMAYESPIPFFQPLSP